MNAALNNPCPRCGQRQLKAWPELSDEEREVVRRLPGSADYPALERQSGHLWCTRCWYESSGDETLA